MHNFSGPIIDNYKSFVRPHSRSCATAWQCLRGVAVKILGPSTGHTHIFAFLIQAISFLNLSMEGLATGLLQVSLLSLLFGGRGWNLAGSFPTLNSQYFFTPSPTPSVAPHCRGPELPQQWDNSHLHGCADLRDRTGYLALSLVVAYLTITLNH